MIGVTTDDSDRARAMRDALKVAIEDVGVFKNSMGMQDEIALLCLKQLRVAPDLTLAVLHDVFKSWLK